LKWSFEFSAAFSELSDQLDVTLESSKIVKLQGSHLGRDDPKRCNQIKIMPFIQTCLTQSESASPKATTLYVYNVSLFLVACLLNRWQRASSARCLENQNKARGLTSPRSTKPPMHSADVIGAEIEVSQFCALRQNSCNAFCPASSDLIEAEIEVSQRWALRQHSCKPLCPSIADVIEVEIEVSQRWALRQNSCEPLCPGCSEIRIAAEIKVRQRWALRQHSCKTLCILSFHFAVSELEFGD
jgi:hypothetical protein